MLPFSRVIRILPSNFQVLFSKSSLLASPRSAEMLIRPWLRLSFVKVSTDSSARYPVDSASIFIGSSVELICALTEVISTRKNINIFVIKLIDFLKLFFLTLIFVGLLTYLIRYFFLKMIHLFRKLILIYFHLELPAFLLQIRHYCQL